MRRYVEHHNAGVRTGDFGPMLDLIHPEAEFVFVDMGIGPFRGSADIARAFETHPPTDELVILKTWAEEAAIVAVYGWRQDPTAHGEIRIASGTDGVIRRVTVQRVREER